MVKKVELKGKKYFMCEECDMYYLDKKIAGKCEDFCKKHRACNVEIIKNAIKL